MNSSFIKWLHKPSKTWHEKVINILAAYTFCLLFISIVNYFYGWLYATEQIPFFFKQYKHEWWIDFFGACIIAPLAEEILFRHLPMQILKNIKGYKKFLLPCMLFTSAVFGYMHQGAVSIPIQGVTGFVLCVVYLKNGYSYTSSVVLHFLWNFTLLCGMFKYMS